VGYPLAVLIATEDDDTLSSAGTFTFPFGILASFNVNEDDDSFTITGNSQVPELLAVASITEDTDTITSDGTAAGVANYAILTATEDDDTVSSTSSTTL